MWDAYLEGHYVTDTSKLYNIKLPANETLDFFNATGTIGFYGKKVGTINLLIKLNLWNKKITCYFM